MSRVIMSNVYSTNSYFIHFHTNHTIPFRRSNKPAPWLCYKPATGEVQELQPRGADDFTKEERKLEGCELSGKIRKNQGFHLKEHGSSFESFVSFGREATGFSLGRRQQHKCSRLEKLPKVWDTSVKCTGSKWWEKMIYFTIF